MKLFSSAKKEGANGQTSLEAFKAKAQDAVVKQAIETIVGGALGGCHTGGL